MRDYPSPEVNTLSVLEKRMTIRERIIQRKERLETEIIEVNEALKLLDENPTFEKIQDSIARLNIGLY